jgi:diguanylate cyclase (GGDEF)-like protein
MAAGSGDGEVEADGKERDVAGAARDVDSDARDISGSRRDVAADERDRAAEARGFADPAAASDRSHAASDREAGALDRAISQQDRTTARTDRVAAADDRAAAALDDLTGARTRASGLIELAREMARAERTREPLTLAYVDVDHLKAINDSRGHGAGDDALVSVIEVIRSVLRSYDLVVRLGGDEFLCVLAGLDEARARTRVSEITAALAARPDLPSVTAGVAEMVAGESPADLIDRADADLYARRRGERGVRGRR